jgi:thiamine biosynthesis lipoprotein
MIMDKKKIKAICILGVAFTLTSIFSACANKTSEPVAKTELLLGTVCNIKIYDKPEDKFFQNAFTRIKELENKLTINKANSEVDAINDAAGIKPIAVSKDTYYCIKEGIRYSTLSDGKYDITVGPLVKSWGIGTDKARVPSTTEIESAKALINYKDVIVDDTNMTVMLKRKGMLIDLGGIAKGFVADEVGKVLEDNGVKHAIINLGGNILTLNNNLKGDPWKIGVQNPFSEERGTSIGTLDVTGKSVTTAGIYERYFEANGEKYHHILDVKTGYPADNELAGVTILTDKSIDGDGIDTAVLLMGLTQGLKFITNTKGMEAIFITKTKEVYITPGLKQNFKLTNSDFKIKNIN